MTFLQSYIWLGGVRALVKKTNALHTTNTQCTRKVPGVYMGFLFWFAGGLASRVYGLAFSMTSPYSF